MSREITAKDMVRQQTLQKAMTKGTPEYERRQQYLQKHKKLVDETREQRIAELKAYREAYYDAADRDTFNLEDISKN